MWKVVALQTCAAAAAALVAGLLAGRNGALSAAFGGLSYILPNALFVARLKLAAIGGRSSGADLLVWELLKLILTVGILVGLSHQYPGLNWIALLAGLSATLMVNLFALLLRI